MALLLLACKTPTHQPLVDETEFEQAGMSIELPVYKSHATGNNVSGTYISEITNNHPWYFRKPYQKLILTIEQHNNQIIAIDSRGEIKISGVLEGDSITFELFGDESATYPIANAVRGKWKIKNTNRLEGTWRAAGHNAGGKWNLRKIEEEKIQLFTIKTGLQRPFNLSESEELFDMIFTSPGNKNVVFYVHGRGQNFKKNFDSSMIPLVETYSDTRIVIIHWLSWGDSSTRPYQHAMDSVLGVSKFLSAFGDYKSRKPDKMGNRKITLLAHSMGNIPLKLFLEEHYEKGELPKSLFNSVILNSADVPRIDHRGWVEKIDFADAVYVIQHRGDLVLHFSSLFFQDDAEEPGPRLGAGFGTRIEIEDLASNAHYLDLTHLNNSIHRHFNVPANPEAIRLFELLLNGREFNFPDPAIGLIEKSDQAPIFYFYSKGKNAENEK